MIALNFPLFAIITILLWVLGIILLGGSNRSKIVKVFGIGLLLSGIILLTLFLTNLWITLNRPPMRTLGETRLWYSLFLSIIGLIFYWRWKYYWFIIYSFSLSSLFLILNIYNP